jgi:N-acyl-D-aspartate/D-glutamate deacylase
LEITVDEFDILINDAMIVEGSLKPAYKGSIAVKGEKVVGVGAVGGDAKEVIDASGLTAVPGFIDSHSHADWNIMYNPKCENYILQGVTTFVGGQCGTSPAPIKDFFTDVLIFEILPIEDYIHEIVPYKYYNQDLSLPGMPIPMEKFNQLLEEHFGWTIDWQTMGEYFKKIEDVGIPCNYAPLVGHGTIRSVVLEADYKRPSKLNELEEIYTLIREAMEDGCIGMSVGLDYDPGCFADRKELVECVKIAKDYGGIFAPHARRTGRRRNIVMGDRIHDKAEGLREVIDICRTAGARMNIAHLFTGWYVRGGHSRASFLEEANRRATLSIIDEALEEGLDISFDSIPTAYPFRFRGSYYLCHYFAPWLRELGTRENFAKWLKAPGFREDVKDAIYRGKWYIRVDQNPNMNPRWAESITVLKHKNRECENKSIAKIAEERGKDPFETWFDLIVEDPDSRAGFGGSDPDAPHHAIFYAHPVSAVGLDLSFGDCADYKREQTVPPWQIPHINVYAAYVGFFNKFVNRQKALTLEQAVYKTSTFVADRYKLNGRGVIKEENYADIVLMDLKNLKVTGTPLEPRKQPNGIEYVFVNGVTVVKKAKQTRATPGRVLRRE